jgi:uncharacterized protein YcnI
MTVEDSLAARVKALIGGDEALRDLEAVQVEELPDGLAFKIDRSNPGWLRVEITEGEYGWRIEMTGSMLAYGTFRTRFVGDEDLKSFIDVIRWRLGK